MSEGRTTPMISLSMLHGNLEDGGKKVLDVVARNQAIDLMKVKSYLTLDQERPKWAFAADVLISKNVTTTSRVHDDLSKTNLFLQSWTTNTTKTAATLPESLHRMVKIANKFCVAFNLLALDAALKQKLPVWHHLGLQNEWIRNNGSREVCLRNNHKITTVGELECFAHRDHLEDHRPTNLCECKACSIERVGRCTKPHGCQRAALRLLDKLLPKWDPRVADYNAQDVAEVMIFLPLMQIS